MRDPDVNHHGLLRQYRTAKCLLILLFTCNMAYIFCRVFKISSYVETDIVIEEEPGSVSVKQNIKTLSSVRPKVSTNHGRPSLEQQERLLQLSKSCNGYAGVNQSAKYLSSIPRVITVDRTHPILYCPLQKVASSFWVRLLTVLGSKGKYNNPLAITLREKTLIGFKSLQKEMTADEANDFVSNLFSFIFVRDPYSRLYSGYIDKVYYPNTIFWPNLVNEILEKVYGNGTNGPAISQVTFAEFIKYIIKMKEAGLLVDKHFEPMHSLCDPCQIQYSFLGKLETFIEDLSYLFDLWKSEFDDFNVTFTDLSGDAMYDDTIRHVSMLFTVVDLMQNSSDEDIYRIINRGWINMQLRGYIDKNRSMPFTLSTIRNVTMDTFMARVMSIASKAPLDKQVAKQQRTEALEQAYRSVSLEDLERLRLIVLKDCELFGYDDRPERIFNKRYSVAVHRYLSDLQT